MLFRRDGLDLPKDGEVRRADRRDVPALVDLWLRLMAVHEVKDPRFRVREDARQTMTGRFQHLLQDRDALALVSRAGDRVVGFALGHVDLNLPFFSGASIGFISDIYVLDEFRSHGRARRLVKVLRQWFRQRQVSSIQLHAAACNPDSHAFWVRMGFSDYLVRMWADGDG